MSISTIHGIYAVRLFDSTQSSEVILDGVSDQAVDISNTVMRENTSGSIYPRFVPLTAQEFRCPITTKRIKSVIDACGLLGFFFVDDTGKPGVEICWQKHAEATGGRASGSSHIKHTIAEGCIVPQTLSVSHQGDATLSYEVIPKYDGTNDPVVYTGSSSLSSLDADDERFTLGPVTLGSQAISGNVDVTINFGISYTLESADSDIWPTFINLNSIMPSITITGTDATLMASKIPIAGRVMTHANTTIYLKKRDDAGASFVSSATAEHIKLTTAGQAFLSRYSGSANGRATVGIQLFPYYDGTNAPIVANTASAIT